VTPPRNPPMYYQNPSYSQPAMLPRDGTLTNTANPNAYLTDMHSLQNKFPHVEKKTKHNSIDKDKTLFSREIICSQDLV